VKTAKDAKSAMERKEASGFLASAYFFLAHLAVQKIDFAIVLMKQA